MNATNNSPRYSLANAFHLPAFVETAQVQRAASLCRALRETQVLGVLVGLPGVGKTWATQYVAQQEPEPDDARFSPILYTVADVKSSPRAFLGNLLDCLGPDYRIPLPEMTRLVCCWIHRRMVELIIVDDADRLDATCWEIVQDIHDSTHCAFLFIGQPDLPRKLGKNAKLHNRIGISLEMTGLTFDELNVFVRVWQTRRVLLQRETGITARFYLDGYDDDGDAEIMKEMYRVTTGNLRRVMQFIKQSERVAALNGQSYVWEATARAVAALMANN
jgi:DNA transposition AAA+ family ATPase